MVNSLFYVWESWYRKGKWCVQQSKLDPRSTGFSAPSNEQGIWSRQTCMDGLVLGFLIAASLCLTRWRRGKGQEKVVSRLVPEKRNSALLQRAPAPILQRLRLHGQHPQGTVTSHCKLSLRCLSSNLVQQQVALVISIDAGWGKALAALTAWVWGSRDPALQAWHAGLCIRSDQVRPRRWGLFDDVFLWDKLCIGIGHLWGKGDELETHLASPIGDLSLGMKVGKSRRRFLAPPKEKPECLGVRWAMVSSVERWNCQEAG